MQDPNDLEDWLASQLPRTVKLSARRTHYSPFEHCICGGILPLYRPCVCPQCRGTQAVWILRDQRLVGLNEMDLGHLTSVVKILGERAEQIRAAGGSTTQVEEQLDIVYAEISSRDKEISQNSGILSALSRALP